MRLFKKYGSSVNDKAAKGVANFLIKIQIKFSEFMNKKTSGLSTRRMKIWLTIFCLFWGGLSIYFITHALFGSKQTTIKIQPLNIPQHINETENHVDKETYLKILAYKKYMDSAHEFIRPGLLDSMNVLEQIYLSQQK